MLLVDKDIKRYAAQGELIMSGYQESNLNGVSYDLTLDVILDKEGSEHAEYDIKPSETVFIKTKEKLNIPTDILGRIAEKNSRMRQGLKVDGPHYQPGHQTYAFLRVQNISVNTITLSSGANIAQIMFEQLSSEPDIPYNRQSNASFQNEEHYVGLGNYRQEYEQHMREELQQAKQDLENISEKIYANVLTIMGIFVAIFSLLTINYQAFTNSQLNFRYIIVMNITLALCIVVMMGIIMIFINKAKDKRFLTIYIIVLAILAAATIIMGFCLL